ncbi:MAG: hypothetical protein AAF662_09120 [Pseudomonadota bacterium]
MRSSKLRVLSALALLGIVSSASLRADPEEIERWFFNEYVDSYLNEAPDFFTAHYTSEVRFITPGATQLLILDELVAVMNSVYVEPWLAQGWTSTAAISADVKQLSEQTYLLTAEWKMTNKDGKSVTHCDRPIWHYLITTAIGGMPRIFSEIQGDCLE